MHKLIFLIYNEKTMKRRCAAWVLGLFLLGLISVTHGTPLLGSGGTIHYFDAPVDAVSLGVDSLEIDLRVRGRIDGEWTKPYSLEVETEFDPTLRETNLVLFPKPVDAIRVIGSSAYEVHPITVSQEPLKYQVAATSYVGKPRIFRRSDWGADDAFLFSGQTTTRSDEPRRRISTGPNEPSQRQIDCESDQRNYPNDFTVEQTVSSFGGQKLRWARRYSPKVKQIVVHHTAQEAQIDGRTGLEKMRALYEYHANNRGWGDVGYHYIIDDSGKIYEGRSGGDYVVGGHAYCNNVGTIGVAMMGNFEMEKPTNAQLKSLKWLLDHLSTKYKIHPEATIAHRGKRMPTIVGHNDLIPTICPGFYVSKTLDQIRKQVASKDFDGRIIFPTPIARTRSDRSEGRLEQRLRERGLTMQSIELQAVGGTTFTSRPGGTIRTTVQFNARKMYNGLERIASVQRSNSRIGIWQEAGTTAARVRKELIIPERLQPGESIQIPLRFQMPREPGTYTVDIGEITFVFTSEGRRTRQPRTGTTRQTFQSEDRVNVQTAGYRRAKAGNVSTAVRRRLGNTSSAATSKTIRIRLRYTSNDIRLNTSGNVYHLQKNGNSCDLRQNNRVIDSGTVRVNGGANGLVTISSWVTDFNIFRGVIECRVIDNELVLINELPLEDYMAGLGEEPDTEPYEKQKAFAVAARSYAAFYIEAQGNQRKFVGKPYDGNDSPANFQLYKGYVFEQKHPRWVRAVQETAHQILLKDGDIIKAAYYSSNDGRTRSPEENGWNGFPHAEVFASKPDPWCQGMEPRGHGVGMSGCGAEGQANEGRLYDEILAYYYTGAELAVFEK